MRGSDPVITASQGLHCQEVGIKSWGQVSDAGTPRWDTMPQPLGQVPTAGRQFCTEKLGCPCWQWQSKFETARQPDCLCLRGAAPAGRGLHLLCRLPSSTFVFSPWFSRKNQSGLSMKLLRLLTVACPVGHCHWGGSGIGMKQTSHGPGVGVAQAVRSTCSPAARRRTSYSSGELQCDPEHIHSP